jgi:tetratricopeptide (TPR) repeat protein
MNSVAQAAHRRAQAAIELRRWDTAVEHARQAIAADPAAVDCHVMLAHALYCQDEHAAALEVTKGALALAPTEPAVHRMRAQILLELDRLPAALAAADEALASSVTARGLGLRAQVLQRMTRRDQAREACKRAIALEPDTAWLHHLLGNIKLGADKPRAAERAYREALRCEPNDAATLNNLGLALQRLRREPEAALAFKAAVLADPTMTLAKQNAHASVNKLTGAVAAGVTGLGALKYCAIGGGNLTRVASSGDGTGTTILAVIAGLIGVVLLVYLVTRSIRKRRVRQLDPQLWELYQKLDRDKRAGRL